MAHAPAINTAWTELAAASIEQRLKTRYSEVYQYSIPLIASIWGNGEGANFNSGYTVEGYVILVPVATNAAYQGAKGVATGAYSATPTDVRSATFASTYTVTNPQNASFTYAQYECPFGITKEIERMGNSGSGGWLELGVNQILFSFKEKLMKDFYYPGSGGAGLMGTRAGITGNVLAVHSTGTYGGISRSTYANWAGNLTSSAGPFTLTLVDKELHRCKSKVVGTNRASIDLLQVGYDATNDIYGKFYAAVAGTQMVQTAPGSTASTVNVGFENFMYRGIPCYMDPTSYTAYTPDIATASQQDQSMAGKIWGFASKSWFLAGDKQPTREQTIRIPGTSNSEMYWTMMTCVFTNDPGANFRLEGLT